MLSKVVTIFLQERIPERIEEVTPGGERTPFIRIKAIGSDFGDIELYDDEDEVTIFFGRFTHSHFSNYDDIPLEEKETQIAEDVFDVLKATFDDELEFWGSHKGSGGFQGVDYVAEQDRGMLSRMFGGKNSKTFYRWSGATRETKS
jgi:hypothetical protein